MSKWDSKEYFFEYVVGINLSWIFNTLMSIKIIGHACSSTQVNGLVGRIILLPFPLDWQKIILHTNRRPFKLSCEFFNHFRWRTRYVKVKKKSYRITFASRGLVGIKLCSYIGHRGMMEQRCIIYAIVVDWYFDLSAVGLKPPCHKLTP